MTWYDFYVNTDCGSGWSAVDSFVTGTASFPYFEDFDVAEGWITSGDFLWYLTSTTQPNGDAGYSAYADFYNYWYGTSELQTPNFDLASLSNPVASFYVSYASYMGDEDSLKVMLSTDGGQSFSTTLYAKSRNTTPSLATVADQTSAFVPAASSEWRHVSLDLSAYAGLNVCLKFEAVSAWGNNLYIDDFKMSEAASVSSNTVSSTGIFSADGISIDFSNIAAGGELMINRYSDETPMSLGTEFSSSGSATAPNSSIYTPELVSDQAWWTVTYSGSDLSAAVNYDVVIDLSVFSGLNNIDELYIIKRADDDASWVALPTTLIDNKLYAFGLTSFSDFGIGGTTGALAVELIRFEASILDAQSNLIEWATATETDNALWLIERSLNGVDFEVIGEKVGMGTTTTVTDYSFIDITAPAQAYYRLTALEFDGDEDVSELVYVAREVQSIDVQIFPNPTTDFIQVRSNGEEMIAISLISMNGESVFKKSASSDQMSIDVRDIAAGQYLVVIETVNGQEIRQISKM